MKQKVKNLIKHIRDTRIRNGRIKYWRIVFTQRNRNIASPQTLLTEPERKEINDFYGNYGLSPLSIFHQFYKHCTGIFDVRFIPDDLYYTYIDPFFNDWILARHLDNKTYYHLLFPDVKQPDLLAYRQNGYWLDKTHNLINEDTVIHLIQKDDICFLKQATDSEGGKGVYVLNAQNSKKEISDIFKEIKGDIVIQAALIQSKTLSILNPSSVNTLRLLTLLRKDNSVKLCSTSLRMGINGAKVDNASSGGITVGVNNDGTLKPIAYAASGIKYNCHPTSNINFSKITIPNYSKIVDLVKDQAKKNPHFRLISWDIALNENDEPVLIEANLKYGELEFHQLNNGPIFGEETDYILKEVFGEKDNLQ